VRRFRAVPSFPSSLARVTGAAARPRASANRCPVPRVEPCPRRCFWPRCGYHGERCACSPSRSRSWAAHGMRPCAHRRERRALRHAQVGRALRRRAGCPCVQREFRGQAFSDRQPRSCTQRGSAAADVRNAATAAGCTRTCTVRAVPLLVRYGRRSRLHVGGFATGLPGGMVALVPIRGSRRTHTRFRCRGSEG